MCVPRENNSLTSESPKLFTAEYKFKWFPACVRSALRGKYESAAVTSTIREQEVPGREVARGLTFN